MLVLGVQLFGEQQLGPERSVAVGDTPHNAAGAHQAGIPCVGVASHNFTADQLRDGGADWVIDSLKDGLPEETLQ